MTDKHCPVLGTADRQGSASSFPSSAAPARQGGWKTGLTSLAAACATLAAGLSVSVNAPVFAAIEQIEIREGPFKATTSAYLGEINLDRLSPRRRATHGPL